MTINNNKQFMKRAFIEAMCEKYNDELSICNESALCSADHKKRILRIVNGSSITTPRKRFTKKSVVALLIAAALLLAGCTAYVYREQIGNFFIEILDGNIVGEFGSDDKSGEKVTEVCEIYTIDYIPDGYEKRKEIDTPRRVSYEWENNFGDKLFFEQRLYDSTVYHIDGENGESQTIQIDGISVYFRKLNSLNYYIWDNGTYAFILKTTAEFSEAEMVKIIKSVAVKK